MTSVGTTKALEKLQQAVNDEKYYEAQQLYKTISYRYDTCYLGHVNLFDTLVLLDLHSSSTFNDRFFIRVDC
jgi:hypothetical protein